MDNNFFNFVNGTSEQDNNKAETPVVPATNYSAGGFTSKENFNKEIRFVKGSPKNGKATCLIMSKTKDGGIIFQGAKQNGTINDKQGRMLPKFDYSTKLYFSLSEIEMANIVKTLNRLFFQPTEVEIKLPHMAGKEPKNITFKFSIYQGQLQCGLNVYVPSDTNKNFSIYLDENELEVLKLNFINAITL